jgi:hypothetical protein
MSSPSTEPPTQATIDAQITALVNDIYTAITKTRTAHTTAITTTAQNLAVITSSIDNANTDNLTKIRAKTRPGSLFVATKRLLALYKQEELVLEAWEQEFRAEWKDVKKRGLNERVRYLERKRKEWDGMNGGLVRRKEEIMG